MIQLPDLSRYDRFGVDTETTGVTWNDKPVGMSIATPDGQRWYFAWGHEGGGNNVTLAEVQAWAAVELTRSTQLKVFFNAAFDLRMLAAVSIPIAGPIEDAAVIGPLLDENDPAGFSLDGQAKKYLNEHKSDDYLNEWCAAQFGGRPIRSAQAKNYWRVPYGVMQEYAEFDPDLTLKLFDLRRPLIDKEDLGAVYDLETRLIPILQKMRAIGTRVDVAAAEVVRAQLNAQLGVDTNRNPTGDGLLGEWNAIAPGVNPLSTDQIAPLFVAAGIAVKRTALGNYSIEKTDLERWADEGSELAALNQKIRELSKLEGTFITSQILGNVDAQGLVHCDFHQLPSSHGGAKTGRFSASDPNLQFFPGDRFPDAQKLVRSLFVPYHADGWWWKADYSQIEYRFLAHYAGGILAERFAREPDVDFHSMLTRLIYPDLADVDEKDPRFKLPRRKTKNTNFAIVYGAGLKKAAATAGVSEEEMKEILATYHAKTGGLIKRLGEKALARANQRGYIVTWGGRKLRFMSAADARAKGWRVYPNERYVGTYKALNYLLQGSAADLIKKAMVAVDEVVDWSNTYLHLTVHDELGFTGPAPTSAAGRMFKNRLTEAMADRFPLSSGVPIRVEIGAGRSWGGTGAIAEPAPEQKAA